MREVDKNLKKLLDRAIYGTYLNHPDIKLIPTAILNELKRVVGITPTTFKENSLTDFISRENKIYGIPLRGKIEEYYHVNMRTNNSSQNNFQSEIALDILSLITQKTREETWQYLAYFENGTINIYGKSLRFSSLPIKQYPVSEKDIPNIIESVKAQYKEKQPEIMILPNIKEGKNIVEKTRTIINYSDGLFKTNKGLNMPIITNDNLHKIADENDIRLLLILEKLESGYRYNDSSLQKLIDNPLTLSALEKSFENYLQRIDKKNLFKDNQTEIEEITNYGKQVLTNVGGYCLKDSFDGILLDGKIQLSADKGYPSLSESKQQDAVGSAVKDETHFINVLADGVGGGAKGEIVSKRTVEEITQWYINLPEEALENTQILMQLLKRKLIQLDSQIITETQNKNASTTFVIALTNGSETIIANIGDSIAYTYDENTDKLQMLTTLDSYSEGLSYEDARYNPYNNYITASFGNGDGDYIHFNVIENHGQRIILSSDGVTDLVSEESFKFFFKKNENAWNIVKKARNYPDVHDEKRGDLWKTEDNISAIVIDLPNNQMTKRRGL